MSNRKKNQKGFVAFYIAILILVIVFTLAMSISILSYNQQKISQNIIKSSQAYYVAEAGIEDSIYRIIKNKKYEATNNLNVGEGLTTVNITDEGNKKIIQSSGDISQRTRILKAILNTNTSAISFHYGAQIDKGGLYIGNNASVQGNVYSNGSIIGQGSSSKITGDAWIAGGVAPYPDQDSTNQDSDFEFGLKKEEIYYLDTAQSFVPSVSKVLNTVSFYIKKVGEPPDQTVRILTDNSGQPSRTSLASGTLKSSNVTSSYSWIDVSFDSPPNLTVGITYWVVIDVSRDDDNYWVWGEDLLVGYLDGVGKFAEDWSKNGAIWMPTLGDLNFKTWMGGEATSLQKIWVVQDAHANTIIQSLIGKDAYYQVIDDETTVSGQKYPDSSDPSNKDMPISYAQIQDWEKTACCDTGGGCKPECVYIGDYSPAEGTSLGPIKIEGNLTFPSYNIDNPIIISGSIWVTGKISASNGAVIKLDDNLEYGYPIIADNPSDQINYGKIELSNNIITQDSSNGGKLLFISTNKSLDKDDPAILLYNNVNKDKAQSIIYSLYGIVKVQNNAKFIEVTGYAVHLENNSEIVYEQGLINSNFLAGPSGGWKVSEWKEIN